ncbi:choloylglycine hydrolase [Lactobacillus selangorensis]|uniref:Choloylglycine hydrolase n=1 Tax=Lactobacillus selangorensis TaxID=81857 RepID=A0A0R2FRS4_9LACO|nr:choloylglycine hydrolase family protein [Lactobacillus selangorensis]KRN28103.1 choloylglycine hydrolase [Lactobacillus selangorensis]KRN31020.1 choloylglycine hydrolase [Lactobacillus selangorensis]
MCTSLTYEDLDGMWYLARTMDFNFDLGGRPVIIPRHYHFKSDVSEAGFSGDYGFVGTGRDLNGYILVDGVNEKGLGVAELYFVGQAQYAAQAVPDKTNVAPHELLMWLLGNVACVADLPQAMAHVNVVSAANAFMQIVVPLHWIVADATGACAVIEITQNGVNVYDDPAGVMTNSPDFNWHLMNLNNYTQLQALPHSDKKFGDYAAQSYGAGSGALGLPGDYTSVSRFVRAAFTRQYAQKTKGQAASINNIVHMLDNVNIPKGVKLLDNNKCDFTQYRAYFDLSRHAYFLQLAENTEITKVALTETALNATAAQEFPIAHEQAFIEPQK